MATKEFIYDETKYIKRKDLNDFVELMSSCDFIPEEIEDDNQFELALQYLINLTQKTPDFIQPYEYSLSMLEMYEEDQFIKSNKQQLQQQFREACKRIATKEKIFDKKIEWGWVENRPIIRCFYFEALELWEAKKFDAALEILKKLYKSNPDDNIGARFAIKAIGEKMDYATFNERFTDSDEDGIFYKDEELEEWFGD